MWARTRCTGAHRCANAASLFFVAALDADDRRWLIAYPVALFYTCFALITVF